MKKALVLSGGGAKGAWSGGVIEYLVKELNRDWDFTIGASTGSLLAPLSSIGEIEKMKEGYTTVNNDNIFDKKPFHDSGKIRLVNALLRVFGKKTSLGVANKLKKKIRSIFTLEDYNKIKAAGKEVVVVVSNMTKFRIEYKSTNDYDYEDFCDWMLTSSSVPILFEIVKKDGYQYLDGGVFESIPIQQAIDMGATEIDVVILSSEVKVDYPDMKNIFDVALRTIDLMNKEINKDDILIGKLYGEEHEVTLNMYRVPFSLTSNSILFNEEEMIKWWDMGYEFAKSKHEVQEIKLIKGTYSNKYEVKNIKKKK